MEKETIKKNKIEDFGDKIGGARKDLYLSRGGLTLDDINNMDEREYATHIKKDNIWPKPNFIKMLSEGYCRECLYFIKLIRDALPAKPVMYNEKYIRIYLDLINVYKSACMELKEGYSLLSAWEIVTKKAEELNFNYLRATQHKKVFKVATMSTRELSEMITEVEIQDFPNNFDGTIKGLTVRKDNETNYAIIKNNKRLYGLNYLHKSKEEAMKAIREEIIPYFHNKKKKKKENSTNPYKRPQLEGIKRIGYDYRKGRDISGEDILECFKFRGGEFGNWNTQVDRQACLNYSFDAIYDLMEMINAPADFASLGGYKDKKLAIAFGSRGISGAVAHYEPANVVINLTKMNGAGSLAHEWAHALDDYIGIKCGYNGVFTKQGFTYLRQYYMDNYNEIQESFSNLISCLRSTYCSNEEMIELRTKALNECIQRIERELRYIESTSIKDKKEGIRELNQEEKAIIIEAKTKLLSDISEESLNNLNEVHKKVTNRLPSKELRDSLSVVISRYRFLSEELEKMKLGEIENRLKKDTNYFKDAKSIDKKQGKVYYQSNEELFARAFESYIEDKIKSKGRRSDYLVHSTSSKLYGDVSPYPKGEERELFNQEIEKFLKLVVTTFSSYTEYNTTDATGEYVDTTIEVASTAKANGNSNEQTILTDNEEVESNNINDNIETLDELPEESQEISEENEEIADTSEDINNTTIEEVSETSEAVNKDEEISDEIEKDIIDDKKTEDDNVAEKDVEDSDSISEYEEDISDSYEEAIDAILEIIGEESTSIENNEDNKLIENEEENELISGEILSSTDEKTPQDKNSDEDSDSMELIRILLELRTMANGSCCEDDNTNNSNREELKKLLHKKPNKSINKETLEKEALSFLKKCLNVE